MSHLVGCDDDDIDDDDIDDDDIDDDDDDEDDEDDDTKYVVTYVPAGIWHLASGISHISHHIREPRRENGVVV